MLLKQVSAGLAFALLCACSKPVTVSEMPGVYTDRALTDRLTLRANGTFLHTWDDGGPHSEGGEWAVDPPDPHDCQRVFLRGFTIPQDAHDAEREPRARPTIFSTCVDRAVVGSLVLTISENSGLYLRKG